jgi:hypothetical protein
MAIDANGRRRTVMTSSAWVLHAIGALNDANSWTGRIHIHKLLYLSGELAGVEHPFEFELYRFGPYSFELDADIRDLSVCDLVSVEYRHPGYGPSYSIAKDWRDSVEDSVSPEQRKRLADVACRLGPLDAADLELIATCCWFEESLESPDDESILAAVENIKPKYDRQRIQGQLQALRGLREQLAEPS